MNSKSFTSIKGVNQKDASKIIFVYIITADFSHN